MTIILGFANHAFSVVVGDRLTTINEVVANTHANKLVVGRFDDGWVTVGYTGTATIDGRETDDWLVSLAVPSVDGRHGVSFRVNKDIPQNLNGFISRIIVGLQDRARRKRDVWSGSIEIGIVGFRSRRGFELPYMLRIKKQAQSAIIETGLATRLMQWGPFGVHCLWVSGGWQAYKPAPLEGLKALRSIPIDHYFASEMVAEVLRSVALQFAEGESTIGRELTTIMHVPYQGRSMIEFQPLDGIDHKLGGPLADIIGSQVVTYSPWILGHQTVAAPLMIAGSTQTLIIGGKPIEIRGSGNNESFFFESDRAQ